MEISLKQRVFSVKQVNEYARALLSGDPLLGDVSVRGEVSNLKYHSSGHIYFSIKDSEALLRCAFFGKTPCAAPSGWRTGCSW